MRGSENPPPPLDHVLQDGLSLEEVVACVEIKNGRRRRTRISVIQTQVFAGARGVFLEGYGYGPPSVSRV